MIRTLAAVLAALTGGLCVTGAHAQTAQAEAGRALAQRHCGGCHALSGAMSPRPDAPAFPLLYQRYALGDLGRVLNEGQIAPIDPPVEGEPGPHPRMTTTVLDAGQRAQLTAYLNSLDPRRLVSRRRP